MIIAKLDLQQYYRSSTVHEILVDRCVCHLSNFVSYLFLEGLLIEEQCKHTHPRGTMYMQKFIGGT